MADRFIADRSRAFEDAARRFWPGPLTIVGVAVADLPEEITAGTGTVGVRVPADERVRELVRECGGALTATSANPSGSEPARSAQQVVDYFGERIELVIDGGEVSATEASTVLDVTTSPPRVLRRGAVQYTDLTD